MFSASRRIVAISNTVGKAEKSSGRWIHSATIKMRAESAIENARPRSIRTGGIGRNRIVSIATIPPAKKASAPIRRWAGGVAVSVSAIGHRQQIQHCNLQRKAYARVVRIAPADQNPCSIRE